MGSVEALHISSLGPLEVGGSQEQYSQTRGGGPEETQGLHEDMAQSWPASASQTLPGSREK